MSATPTLRLYSDGRVSALSGGDLAQANAVLRRYPDGRVSAVTLDELAEWKPGVPSGGGTVWRTWLARDGSLFGPEEVPVTDAAPTLPANTTERTNMVYEGPGFARLRASEGSPIVQGIIAQVLPNGETPDKGPFLPGLGNSPMELRDNPSITNYSAVIPTAQIGVAASFVEVGAWQ